MSAAVESDFRSSRKRPITGWTVLWWLVAFFGVIIAVNLAFVYFALETWPGLTTRHAYEEGLHYNKTLADAAKQHQLGWVSQVALGRATAKGQRLLSVRMSRQGKTPVSGLTVTAELSRAVGETLVIKARLGEERQGIYDALVRLPAPGRWEVQVHAENKDGVTYHMLHQVEAGAGAQ